MCLWAWWHKTPRLYSGFIDCWLLLEFWPNKNCLHSELDILWHLFRKLLHSSLIEFWNSFLSKTKTLLWHLFCAKDLQHLFCSSQNLIFLLKILLYPAANKMFLFVNIRVWTNYHIILSAIINYYLTSFFFYISQFNLTLCIEHSVWEPSYDRQLSLSRNPYLQRGLQFGQMFMPARFFFYFKKKYC